MSKKKFTNGLESIFGNAEEAFQEETVAIVDAASPVVVEKVRRIKSRGSSKDFTSDLDTLLEEALREDEPEAKSEKTPAAKHSLTTPAPHKALSGLDALIRKTININISEEDQNAPIKRVTFTVDKSKLEKLKKIARVEKAYLKDILSTIVAEYIKEYENHRGAVED